MKSKYPLKKHTNIKGELRIKTCMEIAIREGISAAKEYCIKNLGLSEHSWERTYKPRVMRALKERRYTIPSMGLMAEFVKASEI